MRLIEQLNLLSRLDNLIRRKATGSPNQLAGKLEVSERQTYRLINELKNLGFPIDYCKGRRSYFYSGQVKINFEIIVNNDEALRIRGGGI